MPYRLALLLLLAGGVGAAQEPHGPLTGAEASGYRETSRYGQVVAFLQELARHSPHMRLTSMGHSPAGRPIPLAVLGDPLPREPLPRRGRQRPVIYVQANIHAGEVAGKEALLVLLREAALAGTYKEELSRVVLLAAPIFNCDGNEAISRNNRPWQKGPEQGVGTRANGQGLDLNRDGVKLESPEMRGLLAEVILPWDPDLLVDCHTTDGSSHCHPLLADTPFLAGMDPDLRTFGRRFFLPALFDRVKAQAGLDLLPYGYFRRRQDPAAGWDTYPPLVRYLVQYMGARGRLALLSEAYVFESFPRRIEATLALLRATLRETAARGKELLRLCHRADRSACQRESFPLAWRMAACPAPVMVTGRADRVEWKRTGNTRERKRVFLGPERQWRIPWFGRALTTRSARVPRGWLLPRDCTGAAAVLRRHGIPLHSWQGKGSHEVGLYRVDRVRRRARPYQGHRLVQLQGRWERARIEVAGKGWYVPARIPLGRLASWLLEPESPDGLTTWGFFADQVEVDRYHPVIRVW